LDGKIIQKNLLLLILILLWGGVGREQLHTLWCASAGPGGKIDDSWQCNIK
jgi:hypothetical protein